MLIWPKGIDSRKPPIVPARTSFQAWGEASLSRRVELRGTRLRSRAGPPRPPSDRNGGPACQARWSHPTITPEKSPSTASSASMAGVPAVAQTSKKKIVGIGDLFARLGQFVLRVNVLEIPGSAAQPAADRRSCAAWPASIARGSRTSWRPWSARAWRSRRSAPRRQAIR